MEDKAYDIQPARRVSNVQEYYFSKKLKEVAEMNAAGKQVINLGIGDVTRPIPQVCIEAMQKAALDAVEGYQPQDAREENLIRMLRAYKPETMYDEQVQELYRMGLEETRPWQK